MRMADRNLHPHAEARLAMVLWSHEYAHEQNGGSMDFWHSRTDRQKRLCQDTVDAILDAVEDSGRAPALAPPLSGASNGG